MSMTEVCPLCGEPLREVDRDTWRVTFRCTDCEIEVQIQVVLFNHPRGTFLSELNSALADVLDRISPEGSEDRCSD